LAELGYDPAFGARPLRRVIQQRALEPLSEEIIAGRLSDRGRATVDVRSGDKSFVVGIQ
jgi:ATP-dependent Clp protease ATP-binding subunit ClpA